jgi:hypothetical protein
MALSAQWAVLLKSHSQLPHLKLGAKVAEIVGAHIDVANVRLRHNQGIIWENLPSEMAGAIGSLLDSEGFPTVVVPQNKVVTLGSMTLLRKGKVEKDGLMIDDWFGKPHLLPSTGIRLAQLGWINWIVEAGQGIPGLLSSDSSLFSHFQGIYRNANLNKGDLPTEAMGWVLHIFSGIPSPNWVRIYARSFNYSYQATTEGSWLDHFGLFVNDLAKVLLPESMDIGMRASLNSIEKPPEEATYGSLHEMVDRARWELSIRIAGER